jgi:6-phosphogluconolactonase
VEVILYRIFSTPGEVAEAVASELADRINWAKSSQAFFTVALSGGNTPKLLFQVLEKKYSSLIDWKFVHFFWGDERCVPPEDEDSNFGMTKKILLSHIQIPDENVHRIRGENNPAMESERYADEIVKFTRSENELPVMDIIILGMGEDGHTASIFPGDQDLIHSDKLCEIGVHPVSGQKRVTLTGKVINNADTVLFMITGKGKAEVVRAILRKDKLSINYPAALVAPRTGTLKWYLDAEAGKYLQ